jgi:tetratricopeptide (TPR) repeat protein
MEVAHRGTTVLTPPPRDDGAAAPPDPGPSHARPEPAPLAAAAPGFALPAPAAEIVATEAFASPVSAVRAEVNKLNKLALERYFARDYSAALELMARIVNLDPDLFIGHGNYAIVLRHAKRPAEAEAHCRYALSLNPDYAQGYKLLAELLTGRRDIRGAIAAYQRLTAIEPNNVAAHNNAGLLLRKLGRLEESLAEFSRANELEPNDPRVRFNLLMLRRDDALLEEAIACCERSLEQRPGNADVLTNLAVCLQFLGRYDEAIAQFERAVAIDPDNCDARFNLSLLLLLSGEFQRGWREYEFRWRLLEVTKPNFPHPEWQGEHLDGKTILLHFEQGLGDTIQCLRYVPLVAARGGQVVLRLDRALTRIAARLPGNVVISPTHSPLPSFDVWCPLLSLPRIFDTRRETIPAAAPYLGIRPAITERWRDRLADLPGFKVGVVWSGSSQHINDFRRSVDVHRLSPLFQTSGISFVSLQVGPRAGDLAQLPSGKVTDLSAELTDFAETAGAILNLDLVIAVDTAVAHLAGALGAPAWVMLPFSPDWRWMLERDDSPWYPSLRLYRQRAPSDWDGVIARVTADLASLAAGRKPM